MGTQHEAAVSEVMPRPVRELLPLLTKANFRLTPGFPSGPAAFYGVLRKRGKALSSYSETNSADVMIVAS